MTILAVMLSLLLLTSLILGRKEGATAMADRRITQIFIDADVESTSGADQVSLVMIEVDYLPAVEQEPAHPAPCMDTTIEVS